MKFESERFFRLDMKDLTADEMEVILISLQTAVDVVADVSSEHGAWEHNSKYDKIAKAMAEKLKQVLTEGD